MKHKRLLSLLCAAGLILTSVPALPVIAAEEAPVSTVAEEDDLFLSGQTEDGCQWDIFNKENAGTVSQTVEKNGSFTFSWKDVKNAQFEISSDNRIGFESRPATYDYACEFNLGDTGYYGVQAFPPSYNFIYIVEGWAENSTVRQNAGEKLGTVSADSLQYDVYRCEQPNDNPDSRIAPFPDYWFIASRNRYDAKEKRLVKGAVPVYQLVKALYDANLDPDMKEPDFSVVPQLFVYSGDNASGKASGSVEFMYSWYGPNYEMPAGIRSEDGYFLDSLNWNKHGTISTAIGENGSFDFIWEDTDSSYAMLYPPERERTDDLIGKTWQYSGEIDLGGNGYFGLSVYKGGVYDIFFLEGWDENCTAWQLPEKPLGQIKFENTVYDLYMDTRLDGSPAYWCFSTENSYSGQKTTVNGEIPLKPLLDQVAELTGITLDAYETHHVFEIYSCSSDSAFLSGSAHFTKCAFEESDKYFTESGNKDGSEQPKSDVRGDANCDGALDVSDAVLASRIVVEDTGAKISDQGLRNADIDLNGNLEPADITLMLQVIARKVKL